MSLGRNQDLSALSRPEESKNETAAPRRRWLLAALPFLLLLGFVFVFAETARDLFLPTHTVSIVRPASVEIRGGGSSEVVVQAAGWVEPDPFRIRVTALENGVIAKMLVQESDVVAEGDPLCELVDEDARIAVSTAQAALIRAKGEAALRVAESGNARASFDAALQIDEAVKVAEAEHRQQLAEKKRRVAALAEARSEVVVARNELETQRYLRDEGAAGPWQVELAEARLEVVLARVSQREAEASGVDALLERSAARRTRALRDRELRLEDRLRLALAAAEATRADGAVKLAEAELQRAELALSRMIVKSPMDGVVLSREAHPGSVVGPSTSQIPVCHLYDPKALRVRVDVPQGKAQAVGLGSKVQINCDVRPRRPYRGSVIRIVETADIQKVTLEIQVRIEDPDGALKPDMLCRVAILGTEQEADENTAKAGVSLPVDCILPGDRVWVVDGSNGHATQRAVRLGTRRGSEQVVLEGLNASDKVIRPMPGLEEGSRIRVENSR